MGVYKWWQKWRLRHPRISLGITVLGIMLNIIGLGGTPRILEVGPMLYRLGTHIYPLI